MHRIVIVIVGGGIAGMVAATHLGRGLARGGKTDILLVDRNYAHVWKPMLHTFAAGTANYTTESIPFAPHAGRNEFRYWPGTLAGLDRNPMTVGLVPVTLPDGRSELPGRSAPYDTLFLAVGSHANDFGTPGVAEHCFFIDDVGQAQSFEASLRSRITQAIDHHTDRVILTKFTGSANGIALQRMAPCDRGTVVQVGSAITFRGIPLQSACASAKWALRVLHETIRAELAHKQSRVVFSLVNPRGMDTPFTPNAQSELEGAVPHVPTGAYASDDTAEAILRVTTTRRREWNVGAATIAMLLADQLLPVTPMDWIVGRLGVDPQLTSAPAAGAACDPTLHAPGDRASGTRDVFGDEASSPSSGMVNHQETGRDAFSRRRRNPGLLDSRTPKPRSARAPSMRHSASRTFDRTMIGGRER